MFIVDRNASCKQKYAPTTVAAVDFCNDWKNLTRFYITRRVLYLLDHFPPISNVGHLPAVYPECNIVTRSSSSTL